MGKRKRIPSESIKKEKIKRDTEGKYCVEFELSSCDKRICCYNCDDDECKTRCHHYERYKSKCGSLTDTQPLSYEEMMEEDDGK